MPGPDDASVRNLGAVQVRVEEGAEVIPSDRRLLEWIDPRDPQRAAQRMIKDSWRVLRIQSEFVSGFDALENVAEAVTVFGSARIKERTPEYETARDLGRRLAHEGFAVITGGGPGVMEATNRGAYEAGAESIGLNIELPFEQHANPWVTLNMNFRYFFVRKTMFVKYAQAFVCLPGGFGTLDELFEALTLVQTKKVLQFPIVLIGTEFWGPLVDWLRTTLEGEGMISPGDIDLLHVVDTTEEAVAIIVKAARR
ncbi:Rossmann fold nucleotide-binding protein [Gordonia phthalatica]|uniref:Cytokinin riboside 5'-monophosphate phosphoribohydrolase n=1 Tax=Gordonia phthalatica TaxID=1136941 RepID=A0A0N9N7V4_9ACTN|nr:Rossmann fold nucleotide-binding protein [Gordonia phthalatica]